LSHDTTTSHPAHVSRSPDYSDHPPACSCFSLFFYTDTATTEIYTLSLHDALPISLSIVAAGAAIVSLIGHAHDPRAPAETAWLLDRKSTRLNSSHVKISYAVFCLKKKKQWGYPGDSTRPSTAQDCEELSVRRKRCM